MQPRNSPCSLSVTKAPHSCLNLSRTVKAGIFSRFTHDSNDARAICSKRVFSSLESSIAGSLAKEREKRIATIPPKPTIRRPPPLVKGGVDTEESLGGIRAASRSPRKFLHDGFPPLLRGACK